MLIVEGCLSQDKTGDTYPDFITKNEDYFVTRIGKVPFIDAGNYKLKISGLVVNTRMYTLQDLYSFEMVELPLTVECIGNSPNGSLLSTAIWKGFKLFDLLLSLGMDEKATGVKYIAADGYFASHTLEQVRNNGVIGALYMNGEVLPPVQGFPLRILNPGYYGVKQPAWVVEIEVIGTPIEDYWEEVGWDVSPPIEVDSKIFFPEDGTTIVIGSSIEIGGAAFGGGRIAKVEVTIDGGRNWEEAEIVRSLDNDDVWVFWKKTLMFGETGEYTINARSTDIQGNTQPETDATILDGTNAWPEVRIEVID